jgi:uncharacterized protein (DUF433 family)
MDVYDKYIDTRKILALHAAGWEIEQIAVEMRITLEKVNEILQCYENKEEARREGDTEGILQTERVMSITNTELKEICEKSATIGAREALKTFEQERKKEYNNRRDKRLRNTRLLLRNYHMLKEHAENSVFGRTQMKESALDILESMMSIYNDEVIIQSIKNSATRTAIIVSHIETMFGLYYSYCDKSTNRELNLRRYNVIWNMYMAENTLSVKEIADTYNISKDSVYSDVRVGIERLTALIFGVDGLNVR